MLADVVKRNAELEEELRVLRTAFESKEAEKTDLEKKLKASEHDRNYLKLKLEELKRMLFGRRSEKIEPVRHDGLLQAELFEEAAKEVEAEREAELETVTYERKKRRGNRKPLPAELHRERVEIDVAPEMKACQKSLKGGSVTAAVVEQRAILSRGLRDERSRYSRRRTAPASPGIASRSSLPSSTTSFSSRKRRSRDGHGHAS